MKRPQKSKASGINWLRSILLHATRQQRPTRPLIVSIFGAALLLLVGRGAVAETVPQYDAVQHLGVASCTSSQCHGAAKPYKDSNIQRNEYQLWSKGGKDERDKHFKAYRVLMNEQSRSIVKKMGLGSAHEEKLCLDCHADNIPKERRGPKFQMDDGIGCEACHGGGERWIKSHAEDLVTHAGNIAKGMYRTELPQERARLCLSCHYGDANKFPIHRLMAAGHPRLSFELDTYTIWQEHYDIDDDYRQRKLFVDSANTWAIGVGVAAAENVGMLQRPQLWPAGLFPELALFDCHACHHAMKDRRSAPRETTLGLFPGDVRLNDSSLVMLYAIATSVDESDAKRLLESIRLLHQATAKSREAVSERGRDLLAKIQVLQEKMKRAPLDRRAVLATRKTILDLGRKGEFRDYSVAEQAVMAVDLLTFALGDDKKYLQDIDRFYLLLKDDAQYSPTEFAKAMGRMEQNLGK